MANSASASRRYGCPSCGGGLRYDIASRKMKCDQCESLTALSDLPEEQEGEDLEVTEFHCPQCGAAVYSTDTEVTSFCSFCGSDVVLTGRLGRTLRPSAIVPFRITREGCEAAYRTHLKKYLLAPADLKKAETVSHFRPVYVPFWSYDISAEGPAHLVGKKTYTKGNTQYDETYDLRMDAEIRQTGILYDASTAFEDETAALLRHTAEEAEPFHPAFLSGFYAQGANVPAETYEQEAAATAVRRFMDQVKQESEMDTVEMKGSMENSFGLPNARFREKLVMMPVWLLAHRQGQRVVYTAINGQSGEVVCDIPVSNSKMIGLAAVLTALLFLLLQQFLTLRPELLLGLYGLIALAAHLLFSSTQKQLYRRRTRAGEPDFEDEEKTFAGAAQSLLRMKDGRVLSGKKSSFSRAGDLLTWIAGGIVFLVLFLLPSLDEMTSAERKDLVTIGMGVLVAVMGIHTFLRAKKPDAGPLWPRLLCLAACGAGFLCLAAGQVQDLYYYACAAAVLISSLIELILVNRAHNEYASRPVPFFDGKEAAE